MAAKKTEEKKEEPKIYNLEDLYKMQFQDQHGNLVMVRRAYKPRGKLEFYQPRQ